MEEKKGLTDRKDETIWKDVPVLLAVQIPETLDSRSAYSDEKVVTYATDTSYQPVMHYEIVRYVEKKEWKLNDVASGRVSMEEFAAQLDAAQLADLCCGTGWGVQDENNPVSQFGICTWSGRGNNTRTGKLWCFFYCIGRRSGRCAYHTAV